MANEFRIIGDHDTNRLAAAVNAARAEGWCPNGGLFYYNTRFNQQMMKGDCDVPYFIIQAPDGTTFRQDVNRAIEAFSPNAVGLGQVLSVDSYFIQAFGCEVDTTGEGGGTGLPWYSEAAFAGVSVVPTLKIDQTLPYVTIDATASQMAALAIVTNYGTSGSNVEAPLQLAASRLSDQWQWQIVGDLAHTGQIVAQNGYMMVECGGTTGNRAKMTLASGGANDAKGASLEAGDTRLTLLDKSGSALTIADGQEFVIKSGTNNAVRLYNDDVELMRGNSRLTVNTNGLQMVNATGTLEMDANALRIKRGTNQMFSISDSAGAMTWNSYVRCVWNADGWNVSRDNGVAFSSRATFSAMIGPNGSRVEANNTGLTLTSSDNSAQQSKLTMINGEVKGYVTSPAEPFLVADASGTTLSGSGANFVVAGPEGIGFSTNGLRALNIRTDGQMVAGTWYTPSERQSLATKGYVDSLATTFSTDTYDASAAMAELTPGKKFYRSVNASAAYGVRVHAPSADYGDITVVAPLRESCTLYAPTGVVFNFGDETDVEVNVDQGRFVRLVAISMTEWLVLKS